MAAGGSVAVEKLAVATTSVVVALTGVGCCGDVGSGVCSNLGSESLERQFSINAGPDV